MRRFAWLLIVIATTFGGAFSAQSRPDFSGVWVAEGSTIGIRQDGATLAITSGTGTETRTYNLDGSESRFETTGRSGASQLNAQARWVGSALVYLDDHHKPDRQMGDPGRLLARLRSKAV